jgi:ribonuclease HI
MEYESVMAVNAEELQLEPAVYIHEGSELLAQLRDQLAMLPELQDLSPKCDINLADVVPGESTPVGEKKLRAILKHHRTIFLGDGNAAPAPARGVICDLDVGDAKPVAQRPRSIAPHVAVKVNELLKKLLETGLIELSESPWASPIVIVLKKNGVDIRMCIDYRIVNGFIQLSNYPLPLIDDLLIGFDRAMWFMSLDMASGFWAIRMSERAKVISAFVCPFGHFQWVRMPFGLKNAPLVYQAVINNCLWGFVRLPPEEEVKVDQEVLDFLQLDPSAPSETEVGVGSFEGRLPVLSDSMTVFQRNIPTPSHMGPVLGRSSYIDDIAHGAETWDQLCEDLNALLFRLRYWNISVSLPKSEFGKRVIPYLSHEISAEGIRATPKIAKGVEGLPFPNTLKGVQSFLGSLNYYHKFIEDFPVVAAVLYELSDEQVRSGRDLSRAKEAFGILKRKIVSTPLLRYPDRARPFVIIPHANQWAACAVLGQEYDGVIQPVRYTGRVLNDAELRYHIAEKEVIAILRVLQVFRTLIEGCPVVVYTRYSVLKWVIQSKSADGRCIQWGLTLSHWNLEIRKVKRDEDGLAAIMGAGIRPREHLDEIAESLIPAKGLVQKPPLVSIEMLPLDFDDVLLSFDGAAKTSTKQGSWGCILWKLPEWTILEARGFILEDVTVNDAEYQGLLRGLSMASARKVDDLIVVWDSRIVIQQMQGLINCNQPHLQKHLAGVEVLKATFKSLRLVHLKRDFNQAADYLTSKTLLLGESWEVQDETEIAHLKQVSKIAAKLMSSETPTAENSGGRDPNSPLGSLDSRNVLKSEVPSDAASAPLPHAAKVMAVLTRSAVRDAEVQNVVPMEPLECQAERWRRIKVHQEEDEYLPGITAFLIGDFDRFSPRQLRKVAKVADLFVLDTRDILYRLARSTRDRPRDFADEPRLVVPKDLREDMIHYAHEDYQGGHQGITRTFEKLRLEFYWPGMYQDVKHWVEECVDCASGKGRPPNAGPSPGNIEPRRPFELVSMDFVTHMPKSARGNTFLLLFQDTFSGFVMCKPMSLTTAQEVAEAYEECVFRRFGSSSLIRHDQDPRFMSEVFTRFRELFGSRQRATLAYRPQANGQQEHSVQTVVRSIRAYIAEADQSDWDDHAERLMFALNTSFDATRLDTPFYLVHGWDAQSTISAMLGPKPSSVQERTAYEWRRKLQRDYGYAIACAEYLQNKARRHRSEVQTQKWRELSDRLKAGFEKGDSVWLYIPKVRSGLSRKLAPMWHGPFRIDKIHDDLRVKLKVKDTGYRVNPWVHISRLKPRALYPRRPTGEIEIDEDDDFDTALLPEDSWEPDSDRNEYEVEKILDLRWSKRTRTSKRRREYLVKSKEYEEPEWIPLEQLSCGALLYEFNRGARARARFPSMQAGDDHPSA